MAKRQEKQYLFDASAKTVKIPGHRDLNDLLLIINVTADTVIYSVGVAGKGGTKSHTHPELGTDPDFPYSIDGHCVFTLDFDTTSMSDTDELLIYVEDNAQGLKVRPFDFGTDAIERIRVANPQSLIDADFEYGLQATKWQSVGLNRNIPSFFEFPGPALVASEIESLGAATFSTVRVTVTTGTAPDVGTPVSITGTDSDLANGLFVVNANNSPTLSTFDVLVKGSIATGSIYNPTVVVKEGGTYVGSPMDINTMTGDGAGGNVTVTFNSPHGLVPGSPILVVDTTAGTQSHEGRFFVTEVTDGDTIVYDAGQTVTSGSITTTNVSLIAINDSFFIHRPFDGGVLVGPYLPIHGLEAKRQSKRYFRYQSGKGILYSTGALFNPIFDLQSASWSSGTNEITIETQLSHGLQAGATIELYGISSTNYNGTYIVKTIVDDKTFRVDEGASAPTDAAAVLDNQPRIAITKWSGSSIRCGLFDDTNGVFWEFDGQELNVVRRSSTFQLTGVCSITNGSQAVTGTNTRFTEQLKVGDNILIKGQRYLVTTITSDTSISVSPENRGATVTNSKPTIIRELRVPQSKFNYDKIDGKGASGYNIDLSKMQMVAIQYSWYGAGFIDFMLRGPEGNFVTVHRISNSNFNAEAYMRSGNLPARYEVVNYSALDKLTSASGTTGDITLADASRFPEASATYPEHVMVTSNQSGTIRHEIISYTGKSGNVLTGTTRADSYTQFLAGASRSFSGATTAYNHPAGSSAILLNTTCAPTISHWGSAVIMDGEFQEDTGYLFSLSVTNVTIAGNGIQNLLLFRPAPSVSDTIPGLLGEREIINRSQIKLQSLELNNNSSRNLEIAAILNPSNVGAATWQNANTTTVRTVTAFQPSFAQYATSGGTLAGTTTAPEDGEILFRYLSASGTATYDLSAIKEVQNSIIGGDSTYPDGPEVIVFTIANNNSQSATVDIILRWTEAQA